MLTDSTRLRAGIGTSYSRNSCPHIKSRFIEAARVSGMALRTGALSRRVPRYDREFTLFYIDPPYMGHEADYGPGMFDRGDFARLAEMLRGLKGRFLLSINDRPEIRGMFAWATIDVVETRYSFNHRAKRRVGELLIPGGG